MGMPHIRMINKLTTMYLAHTSYTSPSSNEGYPGLAGYTVTNTISGDCTAHPSQPTYSTSADPGHIMQNIQYLGSPVPITKNFLFSFLFFSFDAPLSSWAVCKMTSSHHTLCCHGTHNTAHKTCAIIIPTASPLSERMGSRDELKPSVIAREGTHISLVSVLSPLF